MRVSLVVVCSFVGFDVNVIIMSNFLYVFIKFCLEAICSSANGFKLYTLDHIKRVVFKFIEDANVCWWAFRFKCIGFFIAAIGVVVICKKKKVFQRTR